MDDSKLKNPSPGACKLPGLVKTQKMNATPSPFILDVGGEGRHDEAWNLNPRCVKTLAPGRGEPIPNHIPGRADAIPLTDDVVDLVIVERTPLTQAALHEILRVVAPAGSIVLRHAIVPGFDPHRMAKTVLSQQYEQQIVTINGRTLLETTFQSHCR